VPPPFQRIEKQTIERLKPTPTRYEVHEDFLEKWKNNELSIKEEVYNRFGGINKKRRQPMQKEEKNY
jgi:hypothetical protein